MPQTNDNYHFEMFDLRKAVLDTVATHARDDDLDAAKREAKRLIKLRAKPTENTTPAEAASAFGTSFDRAVDTVTGDGDYAIDIEDFPPDGVLRNKYHDGVINPATEIDGDVVEILTSRKGSGRDEEITVYPVVAHPSGFRICTCPAQRYGIVCPHTLARVIERNWTRAPVPA